MPTPHYVASADLLLGELTGNLPTSIDVAKYILMTAEEIDAKLGFIYQVPIDLVGLPNSQGALIRSIHRKLCSGRIIMAATVAFEESILHQYGFSLVREANMELGVIANSELVLFAPRVDGKGDPRGVVPDAEVAYPRARSIDPRNRDDDSITEVFENNFMRPGTSRVPWHPGPRV